MDMDRTVKGAQMDLLYELDRICKAADIPYFLIGGTLIGAIRHQGFIPWDDDIDVGMLRADYERFFAACREHLDPAYSLQDWFSDPHSPHPFAKLRIRGTHYPEAISTGSKMDDGIFIDLFPYDNMPDAPRKRKTQAAKNTLIRKILLLRCGFDLAQGRLGRRILYGTLKLFSRVRSVKGLKKTLLRIQTRYNSLPCEGVTNMGGSYSYERESKPLALVQKLDVHVFENGQFRVPADYDTFLRLCYGDYMRLPPESEQVGRHKVRNIDLGSYRVRTQL